MENYPLGLIYLSFCSWWMIRCRFSHLLHLLTFCICMKLPIKCGSENERFDWRVYIINKVILLFSWNLNHLDGSFWFPPLMFGVQVYLLCLCFSFVSKSKFAWCLCVFVCIIVSVWFLWHLLHICICICIIYVISLWHLLHICIAVQMKRTGWPTARVWDVRSHAKLL